MADRTATAHATCGCAGMDSGIELPIAQSGYAKEKSLLEQKVYHGYVRHGAKMRINNVRRFLKVKPTFIAVPMLGLILGGCDLSAQSVPLASGDRSGVLALSRQVDCLDKGAAREPMIVEHPNGTLFVSGYGRSANGTPQTAPRLWKSADHGVTWQPVNVGTEADGASANSDVDLAIAPDGTLYLVSMWFDNKTLEGTHIVVGASSDSGNT